MKSKEHRKGQRTKKTAATNKPKEVPKKEHIGE
jgi:hypothetical protein